LELDNVTNLFLKYCPHQLGVSHAKKKRTYGKVLHDPLWVRERVKELREKLKKNEQVITEEDIQATLENIKQRLKRLYKLAEFATDDDTIQDLAIQMNELEKQKRDVELLLFDLSEIDEKEAALEAEIKRFETWAEQVRPQLTDPSYKPTYQELRLAIRILGIRATVYPTKGDWLFRCNIDITIPEIMKKLDCVKDDGKI
jgi:hypothetical protein